MIVQDLSKNRTPIHFDEKYIIMRFLSSSEDRRLELGTFAY